MHRLQKWFPRGRAWGLLTPVALVLCWTALSLSLADAKPMRARWTTFDGALNAMKTVGRTKRYCGVGLYHGQIWEIGRAAGRDRGCQNGRLQVCAEQIKK